MIHSYTAYNTRYISIPCPLDFKESLILIILLTIIRKRPFPSRVGSNILTALTHWNVLAQLTGMEFPKVNNYLYISGEYTFTIFVQDTPKNVAFQPSDKTSHVHLLNHLSKSAHLPLHPLKYSWTFPENTSFLTLIHSKISIGTLQLFFICFFS